MQVKYYLNKTKFSAAFLKSPYNCQLNMKTRGPPCAADHPWFQTRSEESNSRLPPREQVDL